MRFVIQRVTTARVETEEGIVGQIGTGYMVLIGVCEEDNMQTADKLVKKMLGLRIFEDDQGKTNLSLDSVGGSLLLVSQFTLYADCKKGNRPSFINAGSPEHAEDLYNYIVGSCRAAIGADRVATGTFGAHMAVSLTNNGPFTIILDSDQL